jgi:hypothetical protein
MSCFLGGIVALTISALVCLTIAVSLHIAGYNARLTKNEAFVDTTCTVLRYDMSELSCQTSCEKCLESARSSDQRFELPSNGRRVDACVPGHSWCEDNCETCYFLCFGARWYLRYDVLQKGTDETNKTEYASLRVEPNFLYYDTRNSAMYYLQQWPLNSTRACVYDSENVGRDDAVRFERFELKHYYRAYLVFYALFGASLLALVILSVVYVIKIQ